MVQVGEGNSDWIASVEEVGIHVFEDTEGTGERDGGAIPP